MSEVLDEATLATRQDHLAIGHTRDSTTGSWETAQPAFTTNAAGGRIVVDHHGNLTNNAAALAGAPDSTGITPGWPVQPRATSDTDVIVELLARAADLSLEKATVRTMGRLEALTEIAVPAWTGLDRGLCTTWSTGDHPVQVPDAVDPDVTPRRPRPNRRLFRRRTPS